MDEFYMYKALLQAEKSLSTNDVPVGAVIVQEDKIIGRGYNRIEKYGDSLAHAEISAIKQAQKKLGYKHLLNCTIYVTLEPCSMCAGAIILARIPNLVIGTRDPKTGACGSLFNIVEENKLNHRCNVTKGILEQECSNILNNFLRKIRKSKLNG